MEKESQRDLRQRVLHTYHHRFAILKKARDLYGDEEILQAVSFYRKYLKALADYFETEEKDLGPSVFNPQEDFSEIFLISHVYWDLAKAYDRAPQSFEECHQYLDKFITFSLGYKHQNINLKMMRRFLRKKNMHHPEIFKEAFQRLKKDSKFCYIAGFCLGEDHPGLDILRALKQRLGKTKIGDWAIEYYYLLSPGLITLCERNPWPGRALKYGIFRPFLVVLIGLLKLLKPLDGILRRLGR